MTISLKPCCKQNVGPRARISLLFAVSLLVVSISVGCDDSESNNNANSAVGASGQSGNGGNGNAGASGSSAGQAGAQNAGSGGSSGQNQGGSSGSAHSGSAGSGAHSGSSGSANIGAELEKCLMINACEANSSNAIGLQNCLAHSLDLPWLWASTGATRMAIEAMQCKWDASDCAHVKACTPSVDSYVEACADKPGYGFCSDSVWVMCDDLGAPLLAYDCAAAGLQCGEDIWAGCGLTPCTFGSFEANCDAQDPQVLVQCNPAGFVEKVDCRTQYNYVIVSAPEGDEFYSIAGETCGYDPMLGANGCIGTGDSCDFFSQSCSGATLETCAGGKLSHRDCSAISPSGQSCGYQTSGPFAGAASCGLVTTQCSLGDDETCENGVISFCNWDHPETLDCASLGYSGCTTGQYGTQKIAYCVP